MNQHPGACGAEGERDPRVVGVGVGEHNGFDVGRGGKTVRRSIHLTPFGEDFCRVCLPPDEEVDTLPDSEAAGDGAET